MRNTSFSLLSIIVAPAVAGAAALSTTAVAAPAAPAAAPVAPILASRPGAAADSLPAGLTKIAGDAIIYRPPSLAPGPHPLVVLLHGAGQAADELIPVFRSAADKRGLILLAPKSAGNTWDLIVSAERFHGKPPKNGEMPEFGPDVVRIDAAMATVFQKAAIDPNHIILAGFSDGAGYALSLGLANPTLFHGLLAFAPGMMISPGRVSLAQRIFIAHGRADRIIPIRVSRDGLVPAMTAAGMKIQYRDFVGGHDVNRKALDEGLTFVLQDTP
jgi:phospholipase/carboxylesterase